MKISSFLAVSAVLSFGFSLQAQVTGRVTGTVVDASGAAVPGANVGLQLPGSGSDVYTTTTTGGWRLQHSDRQCREIRSRVDAKGFLKVKIASGRKVNPNRATDVPQIKVEVAAVTQTVEVTAANEQSKPPARKSPPRSRNRRSRTCRC